MSVPMPSGICLAGSRGAISLSRLGDAVSSPGLVFKRA
jgi:hypothetical protein